MRITRPRGHEHIVERLWRAARAGRLPHALLFEGPAGIGKFEAARWLAAGLLCAAGPGSPCGRCGPCKRVSSGGAQGNHPDLFLIDPVETGEEHIRLHHVAYRPDAPGNDDPERCVAVFLDLCALEGRGRAVLVRESHRMNTSAQNALLKTLEEPRPGTVLVLETHRSELLLPTIKSRCVRIRCRPLGPEDCAALLATHGLTEDEAATLARWAEGSPGQALDLHARNACRLRAALAAVLAGERSPLEAAAELWELDGSFPGTKATTRARERARTVLDLALAIVRDRLRFAAGLAPNELAHGDLVTSVAVHDDPRALSHTLERLLACRDDVERNLAPEAVVERGLLVLADGAAILSASR